MKKLFRSMMMAIAVMLLSSVAACNGGAKTDKTNEADSLAMVEKQKETDLKNFTKQVEQINKELPVTMADGMTHTKMEIKDGYLVYTCTYPEDADIRIEDTPKFRKEILSGLNKGALLRVKNLGLGIKYVYIQDGTGEETTVTIPPTEL